MNALFLLSLIALTWAQNYGQMARSRCWSSGNGRPTQWWQEGERIDRGKYWYQCERGELSPRGCFTDDTTRISLGESFDAKGYEITCVLDDAGYITYRTTACISEQGAHLRKGETWTDPLNTYYFSCDPDGPYLRAEIKGCLTHDKSKRLAVGERYDLGDYTYECLKKYNGSVSLCSVGCVHNGEHYSIGKQWLDGDYIFYCKQKGGKSQKICVGCQYRQKRLYDGDRYHHENTVFQCQIRPDSYGRKPVACVARDESGMTVEKVIGCRWYLEDKDSRVEQTCELEGDKTKVVTVGCIYRYKGFDTLFLEPDTYTVWNTPGVGGTVGVTCKKTPEGARLDTFSMEQIALATQGLRYDSPRG